MAWMILLPLRLSSWQPAISTPSNARNSLGSSPWDTKRSLVYTVGISTQLWLSLLHCFRTSASPELSIQSSPFSGFALGSSATRGVWYSVPSNRQRVPFTVPAEL